MFYEKYNIVYKRSAAQTIKAARFAVEKVVGRDKLFAIITLLLSEMHSLIHTLN